MRLLPLLLLGACVNGIHDPNDTGLLIKPPPGSHDGPIDLSIANRTGNAITCQVIEVSSCPAIADATIELPAGERWELADVLCTDVDIICLLDPTDPTEIPLRTWRWFVQPALDQ